MTYKKMSELSEEDLENMKNQLVKMIEEENKKLRELTKSYDLNICPMCR